MRPDLVIAAHGPSTNRHWVVHDPVTLNFFRLRDEECFLLRLLDGRTTLEDARQSFERQFTPLKLGVQQLQAFLFRLHSFGLIVGDVAGQGDVLNQRRVATRRRTILSTLANPLAIRLPGIPARPIVDALYPFCRWIFSAPAVLLWIALVTSALALVTLQFGSFHARLPDFWTFFNLQTASWFAAALIATKILHELGHALMCRHFGAPCREFGLLLLLGMPTLYCDVSGAWQLESRWQRILISAGGMLVELVLAAIATWLWWFSEPGLVNSLSLRVMFLCSVSTLVFNANPLLRYDGYYILSDLLDIPNLWQESRSLWWRYLRNWLSFDNIPPDPTIPRRLYPALLAYAVLSTVYGFFVLFAILWLCWKVLEPQGLAFLFWTLATLVLGTMAVPRLQSALKSWSTPVRRSRLRRGRTAFALVLAIALLAAIAFVPVPYRIDVPAWIEPAGAQSVYVSVPGRLTEALTPNTRVTAGQTLAKLSNPDSDARGAALKSEVGLESLRLKNLKLLQSDDSSVAPQIPAAEKALEDAQHRLHEWQRDQERLTLGSPAAGIVLPPPVLPPPPKDQIRLAAWHGTPLDTQNRGCYLETGTLVCQIGDPTRLEAMLVIDQSAVAFVRPGQQVRLRIDQGPVRVVTGTITEIAKTDVADFPDPLARALDLPLSREGSSDPRPASTYYQARVELDSHSSPLAVGMHGRAKILVPWQPLAHRFLRALQLTFRL
jgi:putative peptide zinc metalloprotease protein